MLHTWHVIVDVCMHVWDFPGIPFTFKSHTHYYTPLHTHSHVTHALRKMRILNSLKTVGIR